MGAVWVGQCVGERTSSEPIMVWVLPEPVWPYARRPTLKPSQACLRIGTPSASNVACCVAGAVARLESRQLSKAYWHVVAALVSLVRSDMASPSSDMAMTICCPVMVTTDLVSAAISRAFMGRHRTATVTDVAVLSVGEMASHSSHTRAASLSRSAATGGRAAAPSSSRLMDGRRRR